MRLWLLEGLGGGLGRVLVNAQMSGLGGNVLLGQSIAGFDPKATSERCRTAGRVR